MKIQIFDTIKNEKIRQIAQNFSAKIQISCLGVFCRKAIFEPKYVFWHTVIMSFLTENGVGRGRKYHRELGLLSHRKSTIFAKYHIWWCGWPMLSNADCGGNRDFFQLRENGGTLGQHMRGDSGTFGQFSQCRGLGTKGYAKKLL